MAEDETSIINDSREQSDKMSEAEIDNNLIGSFPASDPPSWTLGMDHQEETQSEKDKSADDTQAK
jgi:hypothetical protein